MENEKNPLELTGKARTSGIPQEIIELAEKIRLVHGKAKISSESGGIHIYFPSPFVVETDGVAEVRRAWPHGSVNAEKFLGLGKHRRRRKDTVHISASCMKTGKRISAEMLLFSESIDKRLDTPIDKPAVSGAFVDREIHLITDSFGRKVPRGPGKLEKLTELPESHQAIGFLKSRGFQGRGVLAELEENFGASYCHQEEPESRSTGVYYPKLARGFKDTPQGRLLLFGLIHGSAMGWQARILEKTEGDVKSFWHPYRNEWVAMEEKRGDDWAYNGPPDDRWKKVYSKYRSASGMSRNSAVLGYDAAVRWNNERLAASDRFCVVVEGPLDAAKLGPPAIALMGSSFSPEHLALLSGAFHRIVLVPDNDAGGQKLEKSFLNNARDLEQKWVMRPPGGINDCGDLDIGQARAFMTLLNAVHRKKGIHL